ncbi:MAG: hypothetical protein QNJ88_00330 [Acidimicrobiia bacterium]|nr:hypothetical protein [Acidimicrobiia bacterium]
MKTLDDRARRAAESIHVSTNEYTPATPFPVVIRRARWAQVAQGALAFAAVVAFIVVGAMLRPTPTPDVADTIPDPIVDETPDIETELPDVVPPPDVNLPIDPTEPDPEAVDPLPEEPAGDPEPEPTPPPTTEPVDVEPPPIAITSPKDGDRFDVKTIWFEGTTEPGATVAAGRWEADVDADGHWAIKLVLSEGANRATFTATDVAGNQATASVVVYYDPPPPPKDDPKEWEFTAHQVYGSCAEDPPYDVFWGTAKPGTVVTISSEYGSGSAEVNGEGEWEVKVYFEEAPKGKVFSVKVKDAFGNKKYFEFVHTKA